MKRLLGLVVLFVVLCVSVPSYGYYLIYNLSGSAKGINNGVPASIPWKGYFVVEVISDNIVDANLIMYGKDSTKAKVYLEFDKGATGVNKLTITADRLGSYPNYYLTVDINATLRILTLKGLQSAARQFL